MISRGHPGLDSREIADLLECSRSELGSTIGDNACGKSEPSVHMVVIESHRAQGINSLVTRNNNNSFSQVVVDYNKERVKSIRFREISDEIH